MIADENKPDTSSNRKGKNTVFHGNRKTEKGSVFVNSQALRKLAGFIRLDKFINRLPAFYLKRLRKTGIAFVKTFGKFNIHYLPDKRSRCLRAPLREWTRVAGSFWVFSSVLSSETSHESDWLNLV